MKFALVQKNGTFHQADSFDIDILIRGGTVIDPGGRGETTDDVCIRRTRFVEPAGRIDPSRAGLVIDAKDCLVTPGLIDLHTHSFSGNGEGGAAPDVLNIPNGVTTVMDAGSSGAYNFESFYRTDITGSLTTVSALLNVCSHGFLAFPYGENIDPAYYDPENIEAMFDRYPDVIRGLKVRMGRNTARDLGLKPVEATLEIAEKLKRRGHFCLVEVHVHEMPDNIGMGDVAALLGKGDIIAHCFSGETSIFGSDGHIDKRILAARERGVLFDSCGNRIAWSLRTATAAIKQGFAPDIIATDLTSSSRYRLPCVCLPNVMSMYLELGMSLANIIKAVTATPASALGQLDQCGTLLAGRPADVSVFKVIDKKLSFHDRYGNKAEGEKCIVPLLTIKYGRIEYRQTFFQDEG